MPLFLATFFSFFKQTKQDELVLRTTVGFAACVSVFTTTAT